jgi:hypothetical protein
MQQPLLSEIAVHRNYFIGRNTSDELLPDQVCLKTIALGVKLDWSGWKARSTVIEPRYCKLSILILNGLEHSIKVIVSCLGRSI